MESNEKEVYIGESKNGEYLICIYNINQDVNNIISNPKKIIISNEKLNTIKTIQRENVNKILTQLYNQNNNEKAA